MIEPSNLDELRTALASRRPGGDDGAPVVCGAATKLIAAGLKPARISMRRLDRVVEYSPADMTFTVEAGMTLDAIDALLAGDNLRLPIDPPGCDGRATIGGVLASAESGPLRFAAGTARDAVIGMSIVLGDGTLVRSGGRVVKNVAGYALHRLVVGTWGQLATIATASLKLRPRPEARRFAMFPAADAAAAEPFTAGLLAGPTRPAIVEWTTAPEFVSRRGDGMAVIIGFEDCTEALDWQISALRREFPAIESLDADASDRLYDRLRRWPGGATFRAAIPLSSAARLFESALSIGAPVLGHAAGSSVAAKDLTPPQIDTLAAIAREIGGTVIVPRRLAPDDHPGLRAGLRASLRAGVARP